MERYLESNQNLNSFAHTSRHTSLQFSASSTLGESIINRHHDLTTQCTAESVLYDFMFDTTQARDGFVGESQMRLDEFMWGKCEPLR